VFPDEAKRAHAAVIDTLVDQVMTEAKVSFSELSAIAVTLGPGLGGCLCVGANKAQSLSRAHHVPIIGVNHLVAHALTPLLYGGPSKGPFVALLVSGGHTTLVECRGSETPQKCVHANEFRVLGHCLVRKKERRKRQKKKKKTKFK
jgi:N6-L-threonylcarbamoyladenine synthase